MAKQRRPFTVHPHIHKHACAAAVHAVFVSVLLAATLLFPASDAHAQAARAAEQTLPEVTVQGQTSNETATGPVVGYRAKRSATASKTNTPLAETPQSISVITRQQLEDQGAQTVQDALRYTAGVRSDAYGFDNRGDWALIRGTSFVQYVDGLRSALGGFYNTTRPDPFTLERVEVLRGPASVLYGQGGFGGLVNLVSKRPQAYTLREIVVEAGSYGRKQLGVDLTGPVNESGTLLYRLIALGRDSGTQVDYVPDDRKLLAPALTWRPNGRTSVTAYAKLQEDLSGSSVGFFPHRGTLFDAPFGRIPTNTFISEPGFDEYRAKQRDIGYEASHQFNDVWTVRQNLRKSDSDVNYKSLYSRFAPRPALNADNRTINRTIIHQQNEIDTLAADTQLEAKWRSGRIENTFLTGLDYQKATLGGARGAGNAPAIDVYNPVYGNFTAPALAPLAQTVQKQTGLYLQHQAKFDQRWIGVFGLRKDWATSDTVNTPASKLDSDAVTGRLGLAYDAPNGMLPYLSYSESFVPVNGVNLFGAPYKPQTSKQIEAGIKYQPKGSNDIYIAALFEITETNRRTPDPANPGNSVQIGEARVQGLELEANVGITLALDMIAAYSYTDAKVTKSNSGDLGKRLASVPEHTASLWARYKFAVANIPGFMAGFGARYVGESWDGNDTVRTPSVTLYDAMLGYDTGSWRFSLNATNLTDKAHVTTCLSRGDCFYGNRRALMARVNYRF
jgi:iron complex outermembrane receptor protein